ncbi:hypothetical protein BY457_10182 [Marinilabilia salmonicolor]|jgi:hypothetical protein|nr:hypothetical protein BY457_10182 [Marinilabilia salmonicolor]
MVIESGTKTGSIETIWRCMDKPVYLQLFLYTVSVYIVPLSFVGIEIIMF